MSQGGEWGEWCVDPKEIQDSVEQTQNKAWPFGADQGLPSCLSMMSTLLI